MTTTTTPATGTMTTDGEQRPTVTLLLDVKALQAEYRRALRVLDAMGDAPASSAVRRRVKAWLTRIEYLLDIVVDVRASGVPHILDPDTIP